MTDRQRIHENIGIRKLKFVCRQCSGTLIKDLSKFLRDKVKIKFFISHFKIYLNRSYEVVGDDGIL